MFFKRRNLSFLIILIAGLGLLLTLENCKCNPDPVELDQEKDSIISEDSIKDEDIMLTYQPEYAFYYLEFNEELGVDEIVVQRKFEENIDAEFIKEQLNFTYPTVQISRIEEKQEVIDVYIQDANYLTQQMGSYGADEYLLHTVYAFTSLAGVETVRFHFKEGDHAEPRAYSRADWNYPIKE